MRYKFCRIYTLLIVITLSSSVNAQNVISPPPKPDTTNEQPPPTEPIETKNNILPVCIYPIEPQATFVGGEKALFDYINENLKYPAKAQLDSVKGTVYVEFTIGKDGIISDAKIKRGIGHGCDEEALRIINNMPKWIPGKRNGEVVQVKYTMPIKFK